MLAVVVDDDEREEVYGLGLANDPASRVRLRPQNHDECLCGGS